MNSRKLVPAGTRLALLGIVGVLSACASTPQVHQETSILDAVDHQRSLGPTSCAALGVAAVCEKSTRLGDSRNCGCVDPHAVPVDHALRR